jgi:hypothetical protein
MQDDLWACKKNARRTDALIVFAATPARNEPRRQWLS